MRTIIYFVKTFNIYANVNFIQFIIQFIEYIKTVGYYIYIYKVGVFFTVQIDFTVRI